MAHKTDDDDRWRTSSSAKPNEVASGRRSIISTAWMVSWAQKGTVLREHRHHRNRDDSTAELLTSRGWTFGDNRSGQPSISRTILLSAGANAGQLVSHRRPEHYDTSDRDSATWRSVIQRTYDPHPALSRVGSLTLFEVRGRDARRTRRHAGRHGSHTSELLQ